MRHRSSRSPATERFHGSTKSNRRYLHRLGLPVVLLALAACGSDAAAPDPTPGDLSVEWPIATPAEVGIDAGAMNAAVAHARTLPRLLSLIVVRHDRLALEQYFNGNHADSLNDVRSVTKSVISTLTGIAVRRGALTVGSPIGPWITPFQPGLEVAKQNITVEQLLTMRSGFEWTEAGAIGYNDWVLSGDPIRYLLRRPLVATPGEVFNYNSAAVHLLSVVLQEAIGEPIPDFAQRELFAPLGITRERWELFQDGRVNGGAGLDLRPRDLAKIGALWLREGATGEQRLLDTEWIRDGTGPSIPFYGTTAPVRQLSYGWLWWIGRPGGPQAFFAWGYGGQFIWVVPALDAVIVVTTDWRSPPVSPDQLVANGMDLIINRVIPALR